MASVSQAVILVGGRGTRLGSLTESTPKPMLAVGGRPFLEYLIALLQRNEISRVLFCISHLGEAIRHHFGDGERFGLSIDYGVEPKPCGTGGALVLAADKLDETFLVLNGDTIFDIPLIQLTALLANHHTTFAAMALRQVDDVVRYGSVQLERNLVTAFEEKGRQGPGLMNGGTYCLKREALGLLPAGTFSLEQDLFPQLAANRQLCAFASDGYFIDIGVPEALARAQVELPSRFEFSSAFPNEP
jgi:D-glycero-D-manno-heptose 1,7-bisphosphate phosphatase